MKTRAYWGGPHCSLRWRFAIALDNLLHMVNVNWWWPCDRVDEHLQGR